MSIYIKRANESSISGHPKYRADIDGLRALAIVLVVGFHAFPNGVNGGFIGVDIFFVISGFLISSILFENIKRETFSFSEFYVRRIRRIFPSLIFVLLIVFLAGWSALLAIEFTQLGKNIAGGAGFLSNLILWNESGYFDRSVDSKPLLHLWSLGIEEQFYILWPMILWVAFKINYSWIKLAVGLALISFAANALRINIDPVATFYSPLSRFWELLIGAILAHHTLYPTAAPSKSDAYRSMSSFLGLALILLSLGLVNNQSAFPGWWALLPTVGSALIIYAGPQAWFNRIVLSSRGFVWVGLISYPLYLWHWPILSFARIINGSSPSRMVKIACVVVSFVMAWLTTKWLERPLRLKKDNGQVRYLIAGMMGILIVGLVTYSGYIKPRNNSVSLQHISDAINDWDYPGGLVKFKFNDRELFKTATGGEKITLFIGDSHAEQYAPAVVDRAKSNQNADTFIFATQDGCIPILGLSDQASKSINCDNFRRSLSAILADKKIEKVVLAACWNCYLTANDFNEGYDGSFSQDEKRKIVLEKLASFLIDLKKTKRVFLVIDVPSGNLFNPGTFLTGSRLGEFKSKAMSQMIKANPDQVNLRRMFMALAEQAHVEIIDPYSTLCVNTECRRTTVDGMPIYKDSDHLRPFFVKSESAYLDPVFN